MGHGLMLNEHQPEGVTGFLKRAGVAVFACHIGEDLSQKNGLSLEILARTCDTAPGLMPWISKLSRLEIALPGYTTPIV
jgi:hypothetical protein